MSDTNALNNELFFGLVKSEKTIKEWVKNPSYLYYSNNPNEAKTIERILKQNTIVEFPSEPIDSYTDWSIKNSIKNDSVFNQVLTSDSILLGKFNFYSYIHEDRFKRKGYYLRCKEISVKYIKLTFKSVDEKNSSQFMENNNGYQKINYSYKAKIANFSNSLELGIPTYILFRK